MSKLTKAQATERQEAIDGLHRILKPGQDVFTKCTHVSRSGMVRHIECYIALINKYTGKPDIRNITHLVAKATQTRTTEYGALKVGGCGMDMGFATVYSLAGAMYGRGDKCAAYGYVKGRNGDAKPETDGGYMLNQRWL